MPFNVYPLLVALASNWTPFASQLASGSVRASVTIICPSDILGKYSFFCSSDHAFDIVIAPKTTVVK